MRTLTFCILSLCLCLLSCGSSDQTIAPRENAEPMNERPSAAPAPFTVENWYGVWTGTRPEYPLLNPQGEVIVVRGREAKVGASSFTFTIGAMGQVELTQSHDDGRVATFSGSWKGRTRPGTTELTAIVCDLTANSTGAYRQFALMIDEAQRAVLCHGTSAEPAFPVQFAAP